MSKKLSILSVSIITVMAGAAISPALGEIQAAFPDANQTLIKLINTLHAIWVIPFTFVSGWLTTRYSKKSVLIAGLIIYIIGGTGGGFAPNIWFLLSTRALLGISVGLMMPISTSIVSDFYDGDERTDMMGKVSASNQIGGVISMTAAGLLAAISWRYAFSVYTIAIFILIFVVRYLPKQPPLGNNKSGEKTKLNLKIYGLALTMFTIFIFLYSIPTNMAIYLTENNIASTKAIGLIIPLSSIGGFLGGMFLARFKHLLNQYLIPVQVLLMGIGFSLIAFTLNAVAVSIGIFIMGLGSGTLIPTIYNMVTNVADQKQVMKSMAVVQTCLYLGQFMSPIVLDNIARLFGEVTSSLIYSISAFVTLIAATILFIYVIVKKTKLSNYFTAKSCDLNE
ncbi:MFS transporter [Alkalibaculum sp. M08DMB]|uniref:MFS transporter n=1 Tax=Alkalibaculum sporogenes TaxID=2655001 RepID=A0A6A7K7X8_9FIRM|nr:MFS transporter [Alkalibaculum sporogenes]MPW25588.1 MFS transporter [Alkalibaculum sporogenes]